ncbi:MAG: alpha/beta hydrolase [bacterium]
MSSVQSRDGTVIAFDRTGAGPALIIVDGALCSRSFGPSPKLAPLLAPHFTVYTYDRRGRGESGNTLPWSKQREVEDIEALVKEAGGSAYLFGMSSGAALSLEAANSIRGITKLALYEAPLILDDTHPPLSADFQRGLDDAVREDRRSDALTMFMKLVGMPGIMVFVMQFTPPWKKLKAVAHTLPYDIAMVADKQQGRPLDAGVWSSVTVPTLAMDGGKSPAYMRNGMRAVAAALPHATYRTLEGQTHMVNEKVVAPVLVEFFAR